MGMKNSKGIRKAQIKQCQLCRLYKVRKKATRVKVRRHLHQLSSTRNVKTS